MIYNRAYKTDFC